MRRDYLNVYSPRDYSNFGQRSSEIEEVITEEAVLPSSQLFDISPSDRLKEYLDKTIEAMLEEPRISEALAMSSDTFWQKTVEYFKKFNVKTVDFPSTLRFKFKNLATVGVVFLSVVIMALAMWSTFEFRKKVLGFNLHRQTTLNASAIHNLEK